MISTCASTKKLSLAIFWKTKVWTSEMQVCPPIISDPRPISRLKTNKKLSRPMLPWFRPVPIPMLLKLNQNNTKITSKTDLKLTWMTKFKAISNKFFKNTTMPGWKRSTRSPNLPTYNPKKLFSIKSKKSSFVADWCSTLRPLPRKMPSNNKMSKPC